MPEHAQQNSPGIIYAIEEPETSQHPIQQKLMMEAFRELAGQGCQVLITSHNPALASLAPISGIRYVQNVGGNSSVAKGDAVLDTVAHDLGVLADHKVRVLVCVEGPNDCNFLRHISKLLHSADNSVPSLSEDPRIAFFHLGGSNLMQWVQNNYLKVFGRPEVHLYDRGIDQPPKYQSAVDLVCARGDNSYATLTGKRDIENYLHAHAIQDALGIGIQFGDDDNVPELVSRAIHDSSPDATVPWDQLDVEQKGKKISHAKARLNDLAARAMTVEMLGERDPQEDLKAWLFKIAELCE